MYKKQLIYCIKKNKLNNSIERNDSNNVIVNEFEKLFSDNIVSNEFQNFISLTSLYKPIYNSNDIV